MPLPLPPLAGRNALTSPDERRGNPAALPGAFVGEVATLTNPFLELSYERILERWEPRHDRVIFSLCTSTRPYYKSVKWHRLVSLFGRHADLVICSNGGVIPIEYSHTWPYMDYDAHREGTTNDALYLETMTRRVAGFLDRFGDRWGDRIAHYYSPGSRNARAVREKPEVLRGRLAPSPEAFARFRALVDAGAVGGNLRAIHLLEYPSSLHDLALILNLPDVAARLESAVARERDEALSPAAIAASKAKPKTFVKLFPDAPAPKARR